MEEFVGDKRTKAYKEWKKKFDKKNSKGLGDTVEKITKATGIKKAVKFIAGEDCGCDKRKEKLNNMVRWTARECPNEEQFLFMESLFKERKSSVKRSEQHQINAILNKVKGTKLKPTSCRSCLVSRVNELKSIYLAYQ